MLRGECEVFKHLVEARGQDVYRELPRARRALVLGKCVCVCVCVCV